MTLGSSYSYIHYTNCTLCAQNGSKMEKKFKRFLKLNLATINRVGEPSCSNRCTLVYKNSALKGQLDLMLSWGSVRCSYCLNININRWAWPKPFLFLLMCISNDAQYKTSSILASILRCTEENYCRLHAKGHPKVSLRSWASGFLYGIETTKEVASGLWYGIGCCFV